MWLRLQPPTLPIVLSNLEPLLIALAFWGVGVAILVFSPPGNQTLLFFLFCQVSSAALASGATSAIGPQVAVQMFDLLLWWVGPLAAHFHFYFPTRAPSPRRYRVLIPLYSVAVAGSLLDLLASPLALRVPALYSATLPVVYIVRRLWLAIGLLIAIVLLAQAYRRAAAPEQRRQVGRVVLGGATGLLPLLVFSLLPDALEGQAVLSYNVTFLFLLALPLSYGYAIPHYRLMRLDRYASRSATYVLVVALWGGVYLLLSIAIARWLPVSVWQQPFINLGLALLLGLTVHPLYRRLDRLVNTLFYGGWYDYRNAVKQLSQVIGDATEVTDCVALAQNLCAGLQQAMQLECACLLLPDEEGVRAVCTATCGLKHPSRLNADASAALQQHLPGWAGALDAGILRRELALTGAPDGNAAEQPIVCDRAQVCVALNTGDPDGRKGLLMLSHKRGQGLFDAADLDILEVITRQAGTAFENAQLATDAQRRMREIEQLHRQVLRGREEERLRLARELHDQTLQEIVGLNFHLSAAQTPQGLKQVRRELRAILAGLRRVCMELRPPALDTQGLIPVMRSQLREVASQSSWRTTFDVEGDPTQGLPEEVSMALFRVFQEALLNARRHAGASRLDVRLRISSQQVDLSVKDDGRGFIVPHHLSQLVPTNHFGLAGLRERVELLGGKLAIHSIPEQGCHVEASIPLRVNDTKE